MQQLGEDDLDRFGLKVSKNPPDGWDAARPWRDRRNGETHQIPLGIDPGFAHNVGRINLDREASDRLIQRIDHAPGDPTRRSQGDKPLRLFLSAHSPTSCEPSSPDNPRRQEQASETGPCPRTKQPSPETPEQGPK